MPCRRRSWTRRSTSPISYATCASPSNVRCRCARSRSMSTLDDLLVASGKVREIYEMGDDTLLLVASDRISAFDVILPTPIPDKGRVLTGMTRFWLDRTQHIEANHLLGTAPAELPALARTAELAGRSMHVRKLQMLPVERVVRGYLVGPAW